MGRCKKLGRKTGPKKPRSPKKKNQLEQVLDVVINLEKSQEKIMQSTQEFYAGVDKFISTWTEIQSNFNVLVCQKLSKLEGGLKELQLKFDRGMNGTTIKLRHVPDEVSAHLRPKMIRKMPHSFSHTPE